MSLDKFLCHASLLSANTLSFCIKGNSYLGDWKLRLEVYLNASVYFFAVFSNSLLSLEKSFIFKEGTEEKDGERINFLETQYTELVLKYKELKNSIDDNPKLNLLHDIPDDKLDEVIERISMLKKSWSWKNKDSCEILECY